MTLYDHTLVSSQIDQIALDRDRPLLLTDADEVLVHFVAPLEDFLQKNDLFLDLKSFRLSGNVKCRHTGKAVKQAEIYRLLNRFFATCTDLCPPVNGAAAALLTLQTRAQIVVLSNIPADHKETRTQSLCRHGMDYPLMANKGPKGEAIRYITQHHTAPVFFIDDLPVNIASAAEHAPETHRIHFIADQRLAKLVEPSAHAHIRIDDWTEAADYIDAFLTEKGY